MSDTRKYPYVSDLEKKRDSLILKMYRGEMTLGEFIRGIRDLNGMTQAQFAKFTKLSRQTIINIEQDKGNYSINTINSVLKMGGRYRKIVFGIMKIVKNKGRISGLYF